MLMIIAAALLAQTASDEDAAEGAQPTLVFLKGKGTLTFRGSSAPAEVVLYGVADGTVVIQVPTTSGAVGFKGTEDMQPTANQYVLKVSSVYNGRVGATDNSRTPATGLCEINVSTDGEIVRSMKCNATTQFGPVSLVFKGHRVERSELEGRK